MNKLLLSLFCFGLLSISTQAQDREQQLIVENRVNADKQQDKPYVILISLDGFRYDYVEKFDAKFLKAFGEKGVRANSLIPSYPSVTFPNHYSIVTGMYPGHHGLVGNNIYDPKITERYSLRNAKAVTDKAWYGGTPLWVLAEQQGMLSACYYWPGSEANIQDVLPTYYYRYSEKSTIESRIEEVKEWLLLPEDVRPHFITFYMPDVDHAGHKYGPDAEETKAAVHYVDSAVEQLVNEVDKLGLPVNYVVVSDHGMLALDQEVLLSFPLKLEKEQDDLVLVSNGTYMSVFVKDKTQVDTWFKKIKKAANKAHMKVYKHNSLPSSYNFGGKDDRFGRVGDIVIEAKAPFYFTNRPLAGSHGFDPKKVKDMHAIFMADGPNFRKEMNVKSFENVHVYPIVTKVLGLDVTEDIDGKSKVAEQIVVE